MNFYSFHPPKIQYFFPEGFGKHLPFLNFFNPYTLKGKITWYLFSNFGFYKSLFKTKNISKYIPLDQISHFIKCKDPRVYNLGTVGPEQKITFIGFGADGYYFGKFAQTPISCSNVKNEYQALYLLNEHGLGPKIRSFFIREDQVLLITDIFNGNRLGSDFDSESILNFLDRISSLRIQSDKLSHSEFPETFCHGDFCPWNMMINDDELLVYDWEMAGFYPWGYDLFTFIFQTNFLLNSKKGVSQILQENSDIISKYFSRKTELNIILQLKKFNIVKLSQESKKNSALKLRYQELLDYAEKA